MADPSPRRALDLAAYEHSARTSTCFICRIVDGTHEFAHGEIWRDDDAIVFLNRFPTVRGYALVAPLTHECSIVDDLDVDAYLSLQRLVHRVARAISAVVPTERMYVLSLGSNEGNAHVHWHVAPLPPGTPYAEQQFAALMIERTGYLEMSEQEHAELAAEIRAALESLPD